jgi:hypothetical protein
MRYLYEITKEGDPHIYIGSTIDMWTRYTTHKRLCKTLDRRLYNYIRDNGGFDSWSMDCVGFCDTIEEEKQLIKKIKPTLNTVMYVCDAEYRKAYKKAWYEAHKEEASAYYKVYREDNKEDLLVYKKAYREANKEAIKAQQNQKVTCKCGSIHRHGDHARHCRSKLHQKYLLSQNQIPAD